MSENFPVILPGSMQTTSYTIEEYNRSVHVLIEEADNSTHQPIKLLFEQWWTPSAAREIAKRLIDAAAKAEKL